MECATQEHFFADSLEGGAMTVIDGDAYAGEALMGTSLGPAKSV